MRAFNALLLSSLLALSHPATELQCMKYVPAVDKNIPVSCDEFKPAARPAPEPPAAALDVPEPKVPATKTYDVTSLLDRLNAMTTALTEAKADTAFRETFCTMKATAQLLRQRKDDKREVQRLTNEHIALEAKAGERGKWINTSLYPEVIDLVLGTPVDDAIPSKRIRQTAEGQAFLKAQSGVNLACNCMYDNAPPKRMICCDGCSQEALKARF